MRKFYPGLRARVHSSLKIFVFLMMIMAVSSGNAAGGTAAAPDRIFTDQAGRTVHVPASPKRVISLAPSITEIVYAVGAEKKLKGATVYSDYPAAAQDLPRVGTYIHLDLERIVSLKPDLCIAIKDGNPREAVERLESLDIPVYAVNPRDLDSVQSAVLEIGNLLGADRPAHRLVADMQQRIGRVRHLMSGITHRPKVFFQIGTTPIISAGSDTFINEMIELAGGQNLAAGYTSYPTFSMEKVLAMAPEVMIITTMDRENAYEQVMAQWRKWPQIPAVRTGRIYLVDSNLFDRPTPRLIDALEELARLIHPELWQD